MTALIAWIASFPFQTVRTVILTGVDSAAPFTGFMILKPIQIVSTFLTQWMLNYFKLDEVLYAYN